MTLCRGSRALNGPRAQHDCHGRWSFSSKCTSNYLVAGPAGRAYRSRIRAGFKGPDEPRGRRRMGKVEKERHKRGRRKGNKGEDTVGRGNKEGRDKGKFRSRCAYGACISPISTAGAKLPRVPSLLISSPNRVFPFISLPPPPFMPVLWTQCHGLGPMLTKDGTGAQFR